MSRAARAQPRVDHDGVRRLLRNCSATRASAQRVVPIIPDEARTFGMDSLFREFGIYAPTGQLYEPVDTSSVLSYKESRDGQILEEGINEAVRSPPSSPPAPPTPTTACR